MKPTWRRLLFLLVVMTGLLAAGCGGDDEEGEASGDTGAATAASTSGSAAAKPAIVLGTKNFTEQYVLGELYRQALEAKGYDVTLKSDIGSTEIIDAALTSGEINVYPEYTGTSLTVVFGEPGSKETAEATYDEAKSKYEGRGQTLYDMTPFSDSDAIAVTLDTARKFGAGDARRPEEGGRSHARRAARVPHAGPGAPGARGELRAHGREVRPVRGDQPVRGARLEQRPRGGDLLHGSAAQLGQVRRARGHEGPVRVPERGPGRRPEARGRRAGRSSRTRSTRSPSC